MFGGGYISPQNTEISPHRPFVRCAAIRFGPLAFTRLTFVSRGTAEWLARVDRVRWTLAIGDWPGVFAHLSSETGRPSCQEPSLTRQRQDLNIGKFCPLPLSILIGNSGFICILFSCRYLSTTQSAAEGGGKLRGGGKTYRKFGEKPLPKKRFWTPHLRYVSPPLFWRLSVISLKRKRHRPDQPQFLRPPKVVLESTLCSTFPPPPKFTRYVLPPPSAAAQTTGSATTTSSW